MIKLDRLLRKKILLLVVVNALLFGLIGFYGISLWSGDEQDKNTDRSLVSPHDSRIKRECIEKATRWLSNLSVDPLDLNERGMKGKKHFVEKLFSFYQLYLHTTDLEKKEMYREILRQMFMITDNDDYHLIEDDESLFKRDIVSYVHACYLMEQLGFNSHKYKRYIRELLPRIERHMPTRNASIQMMLSYFLRGLGFETEYSIKHIFKNTLICNLKGLGTINVVKFEHNSYMLGICHEIFAISEYGKKRINLLTKEEEDYLQYVMESSIEQILPLGDVRYLSLLSELLIALKYMKCNNSTEQKKGIDFIINHQNKNGTFGDFERFRSYFASQGVDIDIKWYLHTTLVCLWALLI